MRPANQQFVRIALLFGSLSMGCSAIVSSELDGKPSSKDPSPTTDASLPPSDASDAKSEDVSADTADADALLVERDEDTTASESGPDSADTPDAADGVDGQDASADEDATQTADGQDAQDDSEEVDASDSQDAGDLQQDAEAGDGSDAQDSAEAQVAPCPGCSPGLCCGNTCCPGTACTAPNQCGSACVIPYLNCNGNIVDGCEVNAADDPNNCGACGNKCPFASECVAGACVCSPGTADCDGTAANGCEVDTKSDPMHCGACLKACAAHQVCGQAVCSCAVGFADCDNSSNNGCEVDTTTDGQNCGTCGNICSLNEACAQSACGCITGFLDCDGPPGCEATATSVTTCGACSVTCQLPTPLCGPAGCTNVCPGGKTLCGTSCIDTTNDPLNCGGCGLAVGSHQHCVASQIVCDVGWGDCNGVPADGCETTLTTDAHCGSCGSPCKPGAVCSAGTCSCAAATPNDCGTSCASCCNASQCADSDPCTTDLCVAGVCQSSACGQHCCVGGCFECCVTSDCGGGVQTCSGNICLAGCDPGQTPCNGSCVDLTSDPVNCGGCGRACLTGRTCGSSKCTPAWVTLPTTDQPSGREYACGVWTDTKLFIWGGRTPNTTTLLNTGATYEPVSNVWTATNVASAPAARAMPVCVWTGSIVVAWGGGVPGTSVNISGGRFNPAANNWLPMAAPTVGRFAPVAVWTGSKVLVWGGATAAGAPLKSGGLYDPNTNIWTTMSAGGAPAETIGMAYAWTGASGLIAFGGRTATAVSQDVYQYLPPPTDSWTKVFAPTNAPKRSHAFAAWINSKLFIWGGRDLAGNPINDGGYIDIVAKTYTPLPSIAPVGGRAAVPFESGWLARSGTSVFLLGGVTTGTSVTQGGIALDTTMSTWSTIPAWIPAGDHRRGVGAWSGSEFMVWGGLNAVAAELDGSRWLP